MKEKENNRKTHGIYQCKTAKIQNLFLKIVSENIFQFHEKCHSKAHVHEKSIF